MFIIVIFILRQHCFLDLFSRFFRDVISKHIEANKQAIALNHWPMGCLVRWLSLWLILSYLLKNFYFISNFYIFCSNFYNHFFFVLTFQILSQENGSLKSFVKKFTNLKSICNNLSFKSMLQWLIVKINHNFRVNLLNLALYLPTFVLLPHIYKNLIILLLI